MHKTYPDGLQIAAAQGYARREVLEMIFADAPPAERRQAMAAAMAAIDHSQTSLHRVFRAARDGKLAGSVWVEIRPGRVAAIWPPGIAPREPDTTGLRLVETALEAAASAGTNFVQSLLVDRDDRRVELLRGCGFEYLAEVASLACDRAQFPQQPSPLEFNLEPALAADDPRFLAVIPATYEKSLDCPALRDARAIADTLQSYAALGKKFNPHHWLLARHDGRDIGCLLLADHGDRQCELVYMGIVPAFRGHGHGLRLVRHAQWLAGQAGASQMTLVVDAANRPARQAYEVAGFEQFATRYVYGRHLA